MRLRFIKDIKKSGSSCRPFQGTRLYVDTGSVSGTTISGAIEVSFSEKPSRANLSVASGDVLFAKMQGTVKVLLIDDILGKNVYSTGFYAFNDPRVLPSYLRHFFLSPQFNAEKDCLSKGATMKAINDDGMAQISINVPTIAQQERISSELGTIERSIQAASTQICLLDEQVKSLFNELFSDCPQIKNVEAIATLITDGEHQTPQRSETGYLLLSARNIGNHELLLNDVDHIPEGEYQRISRRVVPQEGDVLISCSGTIGRVCAVPANLQFQMVRSAALIRPAKTVRTKYLEYALTSEELQYQIQESAVAVAQANLFQGKIKKLRIRVPSLADQDKFIERLNQIDKLRFNYQRQIDLLNELMEKKMEEYFGGEENA